MTVRWITERLGTSPWREQIATGPIGIVDVRLLRDAAGNSPTLIREKIAEARNYLRRGDPVIICCDYGISRSNAIAAAVLAEDANISLSESLQRVIEATGETGIKIDFLEDLRKALNTKRQRPYDTKVLILGLDGFMGRSVRHLIDPALPIADTGRDQALIRNPVLLDAALDEAAADQILFCWHPRQLDTNSAAGHLITGLRNVLEVCRVHQAGLIFLSGQQVFAGNCANGRVSVSETDTPQPSGAAGDALFLGETLVKQYEARHGLATLVVRPSHVYGPGDDRPGILNTMVRKALAKEQIITHQFQNGAPFIDLIHVHDFSRAIQLAIEKQLTGVLHLSSGNPVTTKQLAHLVVRMAGSSSRVASIEMPGNHRIVQLESTIANTTLDWRPAINLEAGVSKLIAHSRPATF
jgi:UDP-glucuronate decarboxylase